MIPITFDSINALSEQTIIAPLLEKDQGELLDLRNAQLIVLRQQHPGVLWDQLEWWYRIGRALPFFTASVGGARAYFGLTPRGSHDWELSYLETPGSPQELAIVCVEYLLSQAAKFNAYRLTAITHLVPAQSYCKKSVTTWRERSPSSKSPCKRPH
jgi:hypothetical protein